MRRIEAGLSLPEILVIAVVMAIVASLVVFLAPTPVVQVEIKEVKVEGGQPPPIHVEIKEVKVGAPVTDETKPRPIHVEIKEVKVEQTAPRPAPERGTAREPARKPFNRLEHERNKLDCLNNMRQIVGLIEASSATRYPSYAGPNLMLYLVKKGLIAKEWQAQVLFCPGDNRESLKAVGGFNAYRDIDLKKRGAYGHLTSYAGRDQLDKNCAAKKGSMVPVILVCDDSEDHHAAMGFVVGYNGGAAEWRDKKRDWKLPAGKTVEVGKKSAVEELRCLLAD